MTPLEISLLIIAVFFIGYSSYLLWRMREKGHESEKFEENLQNKYNKLIEEYSELSNMYDSLVGTNAANCRYKEQYKKERNEAIQETEKALDAYAIAMQRNGVLEEELKALKKDHKRALDGVVTKEELRPKRKYPKKTVKK